MAAAVMAACGIMIAAPSFAQSQSLSRISLDTVTSVDLFRGDGTTGDPDASVDISSVVRLANGWSLQLRPWFFKSSAVGAAWDKEMYEAAVRYLRPGRTSLRVDAGYIASPVGLGMLDMRADVNPTIQPHLSYFVAPLPFERGAPQVGAIAASYPLGASVTVSGEKWDTRAALVSSAPTRRYALNAASGNPKPTPVAIVGGGLSPAAGMRLGGSFVAGQSATAAETADGRARRMRMWTAEAEYAFAYTRLSAEYTGERFTGGASEQSTSSWFVQGVQTLAPRWFVAGRHETVDAPAPIFQPTGSPRVAFRVTEGSVGFRAARELTLRASITGSRFYTAASTDRRLGVQLVWSRRWW